MPPSDRPRPTVIDVDSVSEVSAAIAVELRPRMRAALQVVAPLRDTAAPMVFDPIDPTVAPVGTAAIAAARAAPGAPTHRPACLIDTTRRSGSSVKWVWSPTLLDVLVSAVRTIVAAGLTADRPAPPLGTAAVIKRDVESWAGALDQYVLDFANKENSIERPNAVWVAHTLNGALATVAAARKSGVLSTASFESMEAMVLEERWKRAVVPTEAALVDALVAPLRERLLNDRSAAPPSSHHRLSV